MSLIKKLSILNLENRLPLFGGYSASVDFCRGYI